MEFLPQSLQSSAILFLLLSLSAFIFFLLRLHRKLPYPPGPKGLPIIGNMLMMDQLTHRGLARLSERYGGLCHLQMGTLHIVAVSTPEMAREVLQAQDGVFSNRPANVAITYLTYDRADMAFANYGPFWRQMRKICVMKLFSRKRAESWASVREEVEGTVRTVAGKAGSPINLGELVFALTRSITFKAAFGASLNEGQEEFMGILQEFSKLFGAFNIADFIPWLGWFHAQEFNKRMVNARQALDVFIDKIIDDHVAKRKNNMEKKGENEADTDMVDELMVFLIEGDGGDSTHSDNSQLALKLTRDNIKALIMDVMFGGTETVASVIEWTMAELMKSPMDLQKVQQELTDIVGLDRRFTESDLEKLTYLKCVVKETLRLHPPIPLLLHETAEDSVVAGYSIPTGTRVWINAWAIGRDKSAWDEPETFKPSRFLNDGMPDFKGSNFEFLPFGSGRRSCPGMQLGLYAVEMTVAHLLHCFEWELPNGMKPSELDMNDVFGLTAPRAVQLVAVPSYRLNCTLDESF
ncbi:cytochrome P450 84A1-like [Gastrolobium bilobum]|uniref:cytochrome P450 84A1-like n=1 Tax=Gastrolobium bilobum TaxID=150636 RepID=UPI002AB297D2|nr:cytochrome P450 84A1-like [Gastrolobium bilobum]